MTRLKKQVDFNYTTIAVDQQTTESLVRRYVVAQGWKFPCYMDANSELKGPLHFNALPYNMIIDKRGRISFNRTGFEDSDELLKKLKAVAD